MDGPLDLYRASREELIAVIVRQREQIADLEQRLGRQEAELTALRVTIGRLSERIGGLLAAAEPTPGDEPAGPASGMPGLKPPGRSTPWRTVRTAARRCRAGRSNAPVRSSR